MCSWLSDWCSSHHTICQPSAITHFLLQSPSSGILCWTWKATSNHFYLSQLFGNKDISVSAVISRRCCAVQCATLLRYAIVDFCYSYCYFSHIKKLIDWLIEQQQSIAHKFYTIHRLEWGVSAGKQANLRPPAKKPLHWYCVLCA